MVWQRWLLLCPCWVSMLDLPCKKNNQPGKFTSIIPKTMKNKAFQALKLWVITPKNGGFEQPIPGEFTEFPAGILPKNTNSRQLFDLLDRTGDSDGTLGWLVFGRCEHEVPSKERLLYFLERGNILAFPKMVVPNNHGFSYLKWSFWGVLEVPPF